MITVLPQSEGNKVGFLVGGKLTDDDYEQIMIPRLEEAMAGETKASVLLAFDDTFDGWDSSAMWDDTKFGMKHLHDFEKMAVAGGPGWLGSSVKVFAPLMKAEVRLFEADEIDAAWEWLK